MGHAPGRLRDAGAFVLGTYLTAFRDTLSDMKKDIQRSFRLPAKLDEDLVTKAEQDDRSVSWVICRALEVALYGARKGKAK